MVGILCFLSFLSFSLPTLASLTHLLFEASDSLPALVSSVPRGRISSLRMVFVLTRPVQTFPETLHFVWGISFFL